MSLSPTYAHPLDRRRQERTDQARDQAEKQAEDTDGLVFVDSTGRRALLLRRAGMVIGAAFLVYAGMLGVAFMGGTSLAPSDLSPVGGGGAAESPGTNAVRSRPGGPPPAWRAVRLCRKDCRTCRQQFGRLCRRVPAGKAANGANGADRVKGSKGTAPVRSPRPSAENSGNR
jgi:hypothetical protein